LGDAAEFETDHVVEEDVVDLRVVVQLREIGGFRGFEPGSVEGTEGLGAVGGLVSIVIVIDGREVGRGALEVCGRATPVHPDAACSGR